MDNYETNTNGALVNTTPLFASVWLALYYVVRKNFIDHRLTAVVGNTKKLTKLEEN